MKYNIGEKQMLATVNNFGLEPHPETITVIVLSYNRPRMLREALGSIVDADQVIIVDDGSDFDPLDAVNDTKLNCDVSIIKSNKAPLDVRLKFPRIGNMINNALSQVTSTLVTYLCDDDVFDQQWLTIVKQWMYERPACHIAKGKWGFFNDGEKTNKDNITALGGRGMTSGNFVHRIECFNKENISWPSDKLTSIDDAFLWKLHNHHNTWMIPLINEFAGYRRVHDKALVNYCYGYEMTVDGENKLKERIGDGLSKEGINNLNKDIWME